MIAFFMAIITFTAQAQGLKRGGVKTDTLPIQNATLIDSLSTDLTDTIQEVAIELSYAQRFQAVVYTNNLNQLNYQNLDTLYNYYHQFDPANKYRFQRYTIGPLGSPVYNLLPNFQQDLAFNSGMQQFSPYQFNKDSIAIFKLNAPYTYLNWIFGTKAHQSFEAFHANRIKNIAQFGLRFRRMGGEGYYQNQKTGHTDFSAYLNYDSPNKRYKNIFTLLHNKYAFQQNGGIVEDRINFIFSDTTFLTRDEDQNLVEVTLPNSQPFRRDLESVFLDEAISREKKWTFASNQYLNFGQYLNDAIKDTSYLKQDTIQQQDSTYIKRFIPQFRLKHRIAYTNQQYAYEDLIGNEYALYPNSLLFQSNYYTDTIQLNKWHHELALIQTGKTVRGNEIQQLPFNSYVGLHVENIRLSQQFNFDTLKVNNAWLQAKIDGRVFKHFKYEANLQYALFKTSYQSKGHYLSARVSYNQPKTNEIWGLQYVRNQYQSPYLYQTYQNNFYAWNQSFPLTKTQHYEAFYNNASQQLRLAYQQIRFADYAILDTNNIRGIRYIPTNGTVHRFGINKNFKFGWWHMHHQFQFQSTQNDLLFIPNIVYRGTWYYSDEVFNKALNFNVGIDVQYTSNFNLPVYHPVLGQFFAQQDHTFQFYPAIDFFINFKIKSATFFFKAAYVNQGLFQRGYYAAYNYPQADIAIQGGIAWRFFD